MAHVEIPITHVRGKTLVYTARAFHQGRRSSLEGHRIRFAIADRDTMSRLVMVQTGNGIEQDEQGNFEVRVPASMTRRQSLPNSEYWYEIELWVDDDPEDRHLLQQGVLHLYGSPFE